MLKGLSSANSDAESGGLSSKSFVKKGRLLDLDFGICMLLVAVAVPLEACTTARERLLCLLFRVKGKKVKAARE